MKYFKQVQRPENNSKRIFSETIPIFSPDIRVNVKNTK
jgi:hypothetical protein